VIARAGPPSMHEVGMATVAAALLAAAALPLDVAPLSLLVCPLRAATGIPCLTCGCTRAFHYAVHGMLLEAFAASPLGACLAGIFALHVVWTILRLCGLRWTARLEVTRRLRYGAVGALLANWVFLVLQGVR
jgi:hypothetical protein